MGSITEATIIHHVAIVLLLLWTLNSFNCCHPVAYFASLIYLYLVHEGYVMRLRRKVQFDERRQSHQKRVLTDSESVRWLNHAIEKIWPVCMEEIVSQKILLPIIPWFLQKYKPWTVKETEVQHLYLGRSPPMFTEMRVLHQSTGDDHLVLELGMNFRTADDMSAILAVKLRKRLGFGIWTKLHLLGMHVEGKVLVGVKFVRKWPFLSRLRVCFSEPPYFQMTVKPIFSHGLDVTELPGIAGWLDKLLAIAFEQTLVEPNMLVVDVNKFASPEPENWFSVDAKEPVAHAIVEVIEAADMKPSDLNGLADPYVKGQLGPYRFKTKTQKKTLAPRWHEEFKVPVITWESPNELKIEVRDKDRFVDDTLGECSVNISDFRDGQRHEMWLSLQKIKMGRLHLAITVTEGSGKDAEPTFDGDNSTNGSSFEIDTVDRGSPTGPSNKHAAAADTFEPIDIEGQRETGIWVHHPGTEVTQLWEPRKGKSRCLDEQIHGEGSGTFSIFKSTSVDSQIDGCSTDDSSDGNRQPSRNAVRRGFHKLGSMFRRSQKSEDNSGSLEFPVPSPQANLGAVNERKVGVKLLVDDSLDAQSSVTSPIGEGKDSHEGNVKDTAKNILKHAGKTARGIKHAITRRASRKSKADSESLPTKEGISVESDSSDEKSPPSSVDATGGEQFQVIQSTVSITRNDSFKTEEPTSDEMVEPMATNGVAAEDTIAENPPLASKGADVITDSNFEATNGVEAEEIIAENPPLISEGADVITNSNIEVHDAKL